MEVDGRSSSFNKQTVNIEPLVKKYKLKTNILYRGSSGVEKGGCRVITPHKDCCIHKYTHMCVCVCTCKDCYINFLIRVDGEKTLPRKILALPCLSQRFHCNLQCKHWNEDFFHPIRDKVCLTTYLNANHSWIENILFINQQWAKEIQNAPFPTTIIQAIPRLLLVRCNVKPA